MTACLYLMQSPSVLLCLLVTALGSISNYLHGMSNQLGIFNIIFILRRYPKCNSIQDRILIRLHKS